MEHFIAVTHKGQHRETNEDSVLARPMADGWLLLAVADGVGGAQAGEVASRDAVRILHEQVALGAKLPPERRLAGAFEHGNLAIWRRQQGDERLRGMATTLVAALVHEDRAWIANVGDSRAYVSQGTQLAQITDDHSLVGDQLRAGEITPEEAWVSNVRNVITRTIGTEESVAVDVFGVVELTPGARLLLTSDGVHDVIEPDELAPIALSGSLVEAAQALVDAANERGGPDNISVIMFERPQEAERGTSDTSAVTEPLSRYAIAGITT